MSTEQIKVPEQYSDNHIAQVTAEHPKVFGGEKADEQSKNDGKKEWETQNKMLESLEQEPNCFESSQIKTLKEEFRKLYQEINPPKPEEISEFGEKEKKLKIENLTQKFYHLMITMIRADIYKKTKAYAKKFGISLTEEDLRKKFRDFRLLEYGEFNYKINKEGRFERTVWLEWIGEKLEEITEPKLGDKTDNQTSKDNSNSIAIDKLILQIYRNSIKETNAHFFGIITSRSEIDKLANNKEAEITKEN